MPADNIEFSGDRRFRLFFWDEVRDGGVRRSIRLEHAPNSTTVLDLTDDACDVESWRFSDGGTLLHLRLSRIDRTIVGYPATIDLATGLYYHHPQPRDAHAPAGHASDLEIIARTGIPPPAHAPGEPVRWPTPQTLDWSETPGKRVRNPDPVAPAATVPRQDTPKEIDGLPHGKYVSSDGQWRLEFDLFELVPLAWIEQARIVHTPTGTVVLDLTNAHWDCEAEFTPSCNQLHLSVNTYAGVVQLRVKIDLDCLYYWEVAGEAMTRPGGVQAGTVADLQRRLTDTPDRIAPPADGMIMDAPTPEQVRRATDPTALQPRAVSLPPSAVACEPSAAPPPVPMPQRLRPITSPDGLYRVDFFEYEMRMSHTVRSACIVEVATGTTIIDFSSTLDQVDATFPGEPHVVHLRLLRYPGDRSERRVGMNLKERTWWDLNAAGRRVSRDFVFTGSLDEGSTRRPVGSVAGTPARVLASDDGAWRVELFETGRTETAARGDVRPYYRAVFVRASEGTVIADCGKMGYDAWVMGDRDRLIQLSKGRDQDTWIAVDLAASDFAWENFREPISESYPLSDLAKHLKGGAP